MPIYNGHKAQLSLWLQGYRLRHLMTRIVIVHKKSTDKIA